MSSALLALQVAFQAHLLHGDAAVAGAIRGGGIGTPRRLAIYHNAYRQRLLDALRDTFGHTLRYMGDDWFDAAALRHVELHPSRHASLRDYGDGFEHTLAAQHPGLGELPELTCLDRALRHAFDSADAVPLALEDLGALTPVRWGEIGFVFHPSVTRLQCRHNTLEIWQALDDDCDPPPPLPLAQPGQLLIWRHGHQPHFRSLQPLEAAALDILADGASFARAAQQLAGTFGAAALAADLGALLRRWIDDGLLVAIRP